MYITRHGEKRIVERVGINKASVSRHVSKVLNKGYGIDKAKKELEYWMNYKLAQYDNTACNMKVYGNYLYLFSKEYDLITVLLIPLEIRKIMNRSKKSKKYYMIEEDDFSYDYEDEDEYDVDDYDGYEEGWLS